MQGNIGRMDLLDEKVYQACLDLIGLQEHRFATTTTRIFVRQHYVFILAPATQFGQYGVGLAMKHHIYASLEALHPYSPRLLRARLKGRSRSLSILVGYAPTNAEDETDENRDAFYASLGEAYEDIRHGQGSHVIPTTPSREAGSSPRSGLTTAPSQRTLNGGGHKMRMRILTLGSRQPVTVTVVCW